VAIELARRGRAATVCALSPAGFWSTGDGSSAPARNKVHRIAALCRLTRPVAPVILRSAIVRRSPSEVLMSPSAHIEYQQLGRRRGRKHRCVHRIGQRGFLQRRRPDRPAESPAMPDHPRMVGEGFILSGRCCRLWMHPRAAAVRRLLLGRCCRVSHSGRSTLIGSAHQSPQPPRLGCSPGFALSLLGAGRGFGATLIGARVTPISGVFVRGGGV
jgi:hypothetical protein